jgi:hypothetical protein
MTFSKLGSFLQVAVVLLTSGIEGIYTLINAFTLIWAKSVLMVMGKAL